MEALSQPPGPRPRAARARPPRRVTAALEPGLRTRAFIFNTLLAGQGDQGPAALLRALARLAQPLQRGLRRVGRGADRGGRRPLRAGPALVPAQGAAARPRQARPLRPHGAGRRGRAADRLRRGARAGARLLPRLLPELGDGGRGVLQRRLHRRAAGAGQARRRLLLLRGALGAPVRDAQLHLAARRRADDGPRARPRRARRARAAEGDLRVLDPADRRRDRLDLRRDDRPRAAARAGARRRGAALAARRVARRRRRRGLPPGRDEPLRGPHPRRAPRVGRALASTPSRPPGSRPRPTCSATRSSSPTTTAPGGPTCPHFIDTPGYVYAYAYGHLLALSVYRRYEEEGEGFVPSYLDLLRAGGSRSPEELGEIVGVDLTDPGFWNAGLDLIERRLEEAEEAAAEAESPDARSGRCRWCCWRCVGGVAAAAAGAGEVIGESVRERPIVAKSCG